MGDIDHFKKFNDTYGHDTGDEVLRLVATELAKVKGGGEAFRWGGEEFVLLFAGKEAVDTVSFVEKVREGIEKHPFYIRDKNRPDEKPKEVKKRITSPKKVKITMSFGIASKSKTDQNPDDVMKKADKKLYAAKEAGRNCVIH
jgi:diguanylate cyclase (GGDEF)-like protein